MEWKNVKLGEVVKVGSGGTPSRSNKAYWSGGSISWLTIGDYKDFQTVINTKEKITAEGLKNSSAKIFPIDTVIVSIFATLGRVGILGSEMATNQAIAGIVPSQNIHSRYLMYAIKSNIQKVILEASGVAQKNINLTILKEFLIPLPFSDGKPDFVEQKRIADKLDKVFTETENGLSISSKQKAQVKKMHQSALSDFFENDAFGIYPLDEVCKTTSGGTPNRSYKEYYEGDIIWLKSGELNDNQSLLSSKEHISKLALKQSSAKLFPSGTVLMAMYGATVGKLGILKTEASTNQAVCGIIPNENVLNEYIYWYLFYYRSELVKQAFGGAQPNISQTLIRKIPIRLPVKNDKPDLDVQRKLVEKIRKIQEEATQLENLFISQQKMLSSLKSSVLNQSFQIQT